MALGLLARREHSRRELVLKLRARECPEEIIDAVLDALAAEGMQSDARFAEYFVLNRVERGAGPLRIRAELLARGLDDAVIDEALAPYKGRWRDLARRAYLKRYGETAPTDERERAKRMAFLQQRGFTPEQVRHALGFRAD
ncbi:MAG: regulatory protein RecX [Gammaproteobacteria bacterium]|nr:MAG: regulatory protein RecX [Gammaproteobacteria bacterium]